jgi:hypothetical protein
MPQSTKKLDGAAYCASPEQCLSTIKNKLSQEENFSFKMSNFVVNYYKL